MQSFAIELLWKEPQGNLKIAKPGTIFQQNIFDYLSRMLLGQFKSPSIENTKVTLTPVWDNSGVR